MLRNIEFDAYVLKTIAFARTIVIKCEDIALLDNKLIYSHYRKDPGNDKSKWRYYLNLNGDYHFSDQLMTIQSLDNGEVIEFTKENLNIHLATKRAYRLGSYYYTRLVDRYPSQVELINGIINPIPQSESIPAKDYSILRYNSDYVLWNEYQLIPALQSHIDKMVDGSFKTEYLYTDNLMLPALLTNLYGSLVSAILQIRKEADGTRYAHDFYIWSRLNSLGLSSNYKKVIDRYQTMWLYRNLSSVLRLQGRRKTFDKLLDVILTHRRIPLSSYEALQTTEEMVETLKPTPGFISTPINLVKEFGLDTRLWSVNDVIHKEEPLALDNHIVRDQWNNDADYKVKYGLHSDIPSKILESNLTDTTDRNPDSIMRVLHNEWIYLTGKDLYNINIDIQDIRTGKHMRVNTKESIVLWHYLMDRYRGIKTPGKIPVYQYYHVRKIIPPNYKELMKLGHKDILTEEVCKDILNVHIDFPTLISPDGFFNKCKEVFDGIWYHKKLYSRLPSIYQASRRWNAVEACYETGIVKVDNTETYTQWLKDRDFQFEDYTQEECLDLAWTIWSKVTGWEFNSFISIAETQRGLINLMKELTSYTVQYVGSVISSAGEYNLPYMATMEGDYFPGDPEGETGLVEDMKDLLIPTHGAGIVEAESVSKELKGYIPDGNWGRIDASSIACAKIDLPMVLFKVDEVPEPSVNIIRMGITLREVPNRGTVD